MGKNTGKKKTPPSRNLASKIRLQHAGATYEVTNIVGYSVGYLRAILVDGGLAIPSEWRAAIFTMGPNESMPETILKRKISMLSQGMVDGALRILQGEEIDVSDNYMFSPNDIFLEFHDPAENEINGS